jgi:hypothetical protein
VNRRDGYLFRVLQNSKKKRNIKSALKNLRHDIKGLAQ